MRNAFIAIYAASGAAALIYEVTWTRLLTLQIGHGLAAASTVLAAFMGGLAVGSAAGGRLCAFLPPARALRAYALLELAIAVLAIALPFELRLVSPLLANAYADGAGSGFTAFRVLTSLLLLSLPAAAMGATFPAAARWFVHGARTAAREAGVMYSANTVGAALGALAAGFVLLPALGLSGATWVGVLCNVVAATGAWRIAGLANPAATSHSTDVEAPATAGTTAPLKTLPTRRTRARGQASKRSAAPPASRLARPGLAAAALGVSGFASLTLQVVWTRLLALILGPTTYAFSMMVGVFVAGLAIGAAMASRAAARVREPAIGLAVCLALSVGCAAAAAAFVDRGLLTIADVAARPDASFAGVLGRQALLSIGLLAPMTIAFGAAFPFAVAVGTRTDESVASDLGLIYAVNTAGAIAGALAAGFSLIPGIGLHGTIRAVTLVGAAGAAALLVASAAPMRLRLAASILVLVVAALGAVLPEWDRLLLSSGGYKYAANVETADLRTALTAGELLYYGEGSGGTVAVRQAGGTRSLAIDGKVDASNSGDMLTQRLLAHMPLLLHPNPQKLAILGLGSGVTLGSALTHPIARADVLEISPEVVEAARFFDAENHRALDDPRTRLIVGDGRTHLLLTRERYDVIVSEPSNPWMAGIASLFTREFFQAARDRLTPGGLLCQWAHTYDISTPDLQSIVATFTTVFPDGTLWLIGDGDVLLVGSNSAIDPRLEGVWPAWQRPGVAADLASVGAHTPFHVLSLFIAGGERLLEWTRGAPIQTDDRAALEFSGPSSALGRNRADNAEILRGIAAGAGARPAAIERAIAEATPEAWRQRGAMLLGADAARPAYTDFVRALESSPDDEPALEGLIEASAQLRREADTGALLTRLASNPARLRAKVTLSRHFASLGRYDEAAQVMLAVLQSDTGNVVALGQLASVLADVGDVERMRPVVAKLRTEAPSSEATHYYSATLLYMENRLELALAEAQRVLAITPGHAKAHNLLGACLASLGQNDRARAAFRASLTANPKDPATYSNLATLELQTGNRDLAARYFAEALTLDPTSEAARRGLAEIARN